MFLGSSLALAGTSAVEIWASGRGGTKGNLLVNYEWDSGINRLKKGTYARLQCLASILSCAVVTGVD